MAFAISSLPVPDSPVISTVVLWSATSSTRSKTLAIASLLETIFPNEYFCSIFFILLWSCRFSCLSRSLSSAFFRVISTSSVLKGFEM